MKNIFFLVLICFLALVISGCGQGGTGLKVGDMAPDFTLVDRQGKAWTLSQLKGQVVFINFWATWCPPCLKEMPSMQKLHTILPDDKFKMLAILNNDKPVLADFVATQNGITIPILDDSQNIVGAKYGLTGLPETYVVDKQGIIREKHIGPAQWDAPGYVQMMKDYIEE